LVQITGRPSNPRGPRLSDDFKLLEWDSEFFGFPVAKILGPAPAKLERTLVELRTRGVRLAYWTRAGLSGQDLATLQAKGGILVDQRTTLERTLSPASAEPSTNVTEYTGESADAALISLAIQSGAYSRFRLDPKIPPGKFEELYSQWIRNSVNHRIADKVFVARDNDSIMGMITCKRHGEVGEIGLVAVNDEARGKGIGTDLVKFADSWFFGAGMKSSRVVTQGANQPALQLYLKCGYHVTQTEPTLHFWLS